MRVQGKFLPLLISFCRLFEVTGARDVSQTQQRMATTKHVTVVVVQCSEATVEQRSETKVQRKVAIEWNSRRHAIVIC